MNQNFTKAERLKSRRIIGQLFAEGASYAVYPLRLVYLPTTFSESAVSVKIAVTVPKRHFKKAVDRNRLKRQIREAFRLQKYTLEKALPPTQQYAWMLIYTGKTTVPYADIDKAMRGIMGRFKRHIRRQNNPT